MAGVLPVMMVMKRVMTMTIMIIQGAHIMFCNLDKLMTSLCFFFLKVIS